MNLWGTSLVVLSACGSGQGKVRPGEGLYGLRRAFFIAGAETVVASLWEIDDRKTPSLMAAYYKNLLGGQGRGESMRQAMLAMRVHHPHPHYWAPFLVFGDTRPWKRKP